MKIRKVYRLKNSVQLVLCVIALYSIVFIGLHIATVRAERIDNQNEQFERR